MEDDDYDSMYGPCKGNWLLGAALGWLAAAAAIIWLLWWLTGVAVTPASAHDAIPTKSQPLGWTYDYSCCNLLDCREIKTSAVKVVAEGYQVAINGETIPYGDKRIKRSKDEFYHLCTVGGRDDTRTICLYTPDRGF